MLVVFTGSIFIFMALTMDTSVPSEYGGRVNNIGLMADRQNYILVSCLVFVVGFITALAGFLQGRNSNINTIVQCPQCGQLAHAIETKQGNNFNTSVSFDYWKGLVKDFFIWIMFLIGFVGIVYLLYVIKN